MTKRTGSVEVEIAPTEDIIDEARNGRMFVLMDDDDRENEGDLVIPAQMATPNAINFMVTHGRGLVCLALSRARADQLNLPMMSAKNETRHETAFTVSIEARHGVTTGISAADRARTIAVAIDAGKGPECLVSPGHMFPLVARDGGVLVRSGHTEGAVDIARLAGLNPSGVICEILKPDGSMARLRDIAPFAAQFGLKIGTIRDLITYRLRCDHLVECVASSSFLSAFGGAFVAKVYRNVLDGVESLVLMKGGVRPGAPTLVRMHGVSPFHDMLGQPGARNGLLQRSMSALGEEGAGIIVLLRTDDRHTLSQGVLLGEQAPEFDGRLIGIGAQILADLGVSDIVLLSNSDHQLVALDGYGLKVVGRQPIPD
ncbi:MAG: 3,4-dihydroxy-2-butanone-4-phosphate synthase [Hyphomonadaceae bacterium]